MPRGDSYDLQGQGGGQVYSGTDAAVGPFRWVQTVGDTNFSVFTAPNITNASAKLINVSIPAGIGIGGNITGFTLASGVVIAYRA
jgi:hypothetical protein